MSAAKRGDPPAPGLLTDDDDEFTVFDRQRQALDRDGSGDETPDEPLLDPARRAWCDQARERSQHLARRERRAVLVAHVRPSTSPAKSDPPGARTREAEFLLA